MTRSIGCGAGAKQTQLARLVALCAQQSVQLIEDDTYRALGDDDVPLAALKGFDDTRKVIHCAPLRTTTAPGTWLRTPEGNMLLWIELPEQRSAQAVFEAALEKGIRIAPGRLFSNSTRCAHFMRINCATPFAAETEEGSKVLAATVRPMG